MERDRLSLAVGIVSLALLLSAGVGAASAQSASAGLGDSITRVEQGDTATLTVTLANTSEATVVLGGSGGYNITITVTDGNGDGAVPLEFATDPIGTMRTRFAPVDDGDDYGTLNAAPDAGYNVSVGEYSIDVFAGHGVSGEPADVGTLVVTEASPPPEAAIEGEAPLTLRAAEGQSVSGTTELDAGRPVTVRLRSTGNNPLMLSREATVGEDGRFSAAFNLTGASAPTNATATVYADGEQIAGPKAVEVVAEQSSSPGQPGFGVAVAVLALVGALVVALRRR